MYQGSSGAYRFLAAAYDPGIHGSQKHYCSQLGINYNTFRNQICRLRREAGIPPRPKTNYGPLVEEFKQSSESIREFCQNRRLKENNFRMALYRRGYRPSEDEKRRKAEIKEKETTWWTKIFTGQETFCEVVSEEEIPSC